MEEAVVQKIKKVVAANFDKSYEIYQAFEEKYGFFAKLALKLAAAAGVGRGARVLDIGCGSGDSSAALSRELDCTVLGLDLSPGMIAHGCQKIRDKRVRLEVGDAANPQAVTGSEKFDAALYNASIFIIPDAGKSLAAAAACLHPGGFLGFSFYPQIVSADGKDLFELSFRRCDLPLPRARVITRYEKALAGLEKCCKAFSESVWEMPFSMDFLQDFFFIPAQSASLFPQLAFEERKALLPGLFAAIAPEADTAKVVWRLASGSV